MIDLALYYAKNKWPVFPLCPGGKIPAIRGGRGRNDATRDIKQIEAWWSTYPEANIGIATGGLSGLLVIDVDPRKSALWLASVNALKLPQTFTVRTASGGFHLYFALPPSSKISIGVDLLAAIDWRGNGGYVVGAGSIVNGVTYEIVRKCAIAPAPAALLERIAARQQKGACIAAYDGSTGMVIREGKRNDQLFRIGCALRRFGVDLSAMYEALHAVNVEHCSPPMAEGELRTIAASAMRYAPDSAACAKDAGS